MSEEGQIPSTRRLGDFPIVGTLANNTILQFISAQLGFVVRTMAQLKTDLAIVFSDIGGSLALSQIDTTGANNGQVLTFNSGTGQVEWQDGGGGLGDLEFLRDKELSGDLIIAYGTRTGAGVLASYTPANGKTFFAVKALGSIEAGGADYANYQIRNNTTIIAEFSLSIEAGRAYPNQEVNAIAGDSLVGTGALVYDINIQDVGGAVNKNGTLQGWIQDT